MKAKEIHDLLLSLFLRGLGIWLLYLAIENVYSISNDLFRTIFPQPNYPPTWSDLWFLAVRVLLAAYFILGAPPFLKWATRKTD